MTTKPRIGVVIGSTRPGRYADKAAGWILKQAQARADIEAELLDLLDHPLPFFDEKGPLISVPSENAEALRWQKTLARCGGTERDFGSSGSGAREAQEPSHGSLPRRSPSSSRWPRRIDSGEQSAFAASCSSCRSACRSAQSRNTCGGFSNRARLVNAGRRFSGTTPTRSGPATSCKPSISCSAHLRVLLDRARIAAGRALRCDPVAGERMGDTATPRGDRMGRETSVPDSRQRRQVRHVV